jgi:hypothetical protein
MFFERYDLAITGLSVIPKLALIAVTFKPLISAAQLFEVAEFSLLGN